MQFWSVPITASPMRRVCCLLSCFFLQLAAAQWTTLPFADVGTDGVVNTLAAVDCSGMDPAGLCSVVGAAPILVGGAFNRIGGLPAGEVGSRGLAAFLPALGNWSLASPSGGLDGPASAIATGASGLIFVGGSEFDHAGGVAASNVASLNASTGAWNALGSGLDGPCYALALLPERGLLFAGGAFTTAGGVAASRVASYSLATGAWSALASGASGVNGLVYATLGGVVLPGVAAGVAVAGGFSLPAPTVTLWDPLQAAFDMPGSGLPLRIRGTLALAVGLGADLLAGGDFVSPGACLASYSVARGSWSPLAGGGVSSSSLGAAVQALAMAPAGPAAGSLFVGGVFNAAGGGGSANGSSSLTNISNIARFDGAQWADLAGGVTGGGGAGVLALLVAADGSLVVAGDFSAAGGTPASNIAIWRQPPSVSPSASVSVSPSTSNSPSTAPSTSPSTSVTPVSPSASATMSVSPSTSASTSISATGSPPPPSPSSPPVAALPVVVIAASTMGGVAAAAMVIGVFLTCKCSRLQAGFRRRRRLGAATGGGGRGDNDDDDSDSLSRLELAGSMSEQQSTPLLGEHKAEGGATEYGTAVASAASVDVETATIAADTAVAHAVDNTDDASSTAEPMDTSASAADPRDAEYGYNDQHRTAASAASAAAASSYVPPAVSGVDDSSASNGDAVSPPPAPLRTPHDVDAAARILGAVAYAAPTRSAPAQALPRAFLRD